MLTWLAEGIHKALECANAVLGARIDLKKLVDIRLNVVQGSDGNTDNNKPVQNPNSPANPSRAPHFVENTIVLLRELH